MGIGLSDYSEGVRNNPSTTKYDGPAFRYTSREYSGAAADFNGANGDCRSQASAAINPRAVVSRSRTPMSTHGNSLPAVLTGQADQRFCRLKFSPS